MKKKKTLKKNKKKKGFTLIELLAVILVLSVVSFIAVPVVGNIISDVKEGSVKVSAKTYVSQIEMEVEKSMLRGNSIPDGEYEVGDIEVSLNGQTPISGTFVLVKGEVVSANLVYEEYTVTYSEGRYNVTKEEDSSAYVDGTAIYFNPVTASKCTQTEANNNTNLNSGCLKWYVFLDNNSSTVNMILAHDIESIVSYDMSMDATYGPTDALNALQTGTSGFNSSLVRNDSYTYNYGSINYTINYTGMKARFITVEEILQITNNTNFDITKYNDYYYFDNNSSTMPTLDGFSNYAWLYDNTYNCRGCYNDNALSSGYWTASSTDDIDAWLVSSDGKLFSEMVDTYSGIRPVITVEKSLLK